MYTDRLAGYAAAFRYEQLPAEAVAAAKVIMLDTLGAMLLGSLPMYAGGRLTAELARSLGDRPEPPPASGHPAPKACTVIAGGFKADAASAALANGVLGYQADVEGGGVCRQHAAAVLVPTVLTLGEREQADGRALIAALAIDYDVAARIDRAAEPGVHFARSFHPSAVFGHFGAAATAGHLLGLDGRRMAHALGLAGLNASGLAVWMQSAAEDPRPYVIGMAAHHGVVAALLAQMGMGGPLGILDDGKYSIYEAFTGAVHLDELTRELGEVFWITRHSGFKPYPCCGGGAIHTAIAALLKIVHENDLSPDDIVEIVDRVTPGQDDPVLLKSHCTEYVLAVAAGRGEIAPDAIVVDYRAEDPCVGELFGRTRLVADEAVAALGPAAATVEVRTRDGRFFRETGVHRPGSPEAPQTPEQLEAKFLRLATTRIGWPAAERVRDLVRRLEELPDAAELVALLSTH
jgi:2-methylcitrate dehydratase PrpD